MSTEYLVISAESDAVVNLVVSDPEPEVISVFNGVVFGGGETAVAVESVNGATGAVVLDAGGVGAEPAGAVAAHAGDSGNVHTQYQLAANMGPYLTAAAPVVHTHDYQSAGAYLTTAQPVGNYLTTAAQVVHSHEYQSTGVYLTTAALSNHSHDLAGTGFSGTNVSGTVNSNGIQLSVGAPGGGAADGYNPIVFGGSTANSSQSINFSNSNGISFGLNGTVVTASHNGYTGQTNQFLTTAQPVGAYLTTAALSNHEHSYSNATTAVSSRVIGIAAGAGTMSGNVTITGSNGISVGSNGNQVVISLIDSHHVEGILLAGNNNGTAFSIMSSGSQTINLAGAISASQAGNAFTLSVPAQTVQTQGMVSVNGSTGAVTGVQLTANAMQTGERANYIPVANSSAYQTATLSNTFAVTSHTHTYQAAGAYLTTAAQVSHSHGGVSLALTNLNGSTASASNGLTLSLSIAAGAGGADGWNQIIAGGQTFNSTEGITFGNSGNFSFVTTNGSIIGSVADPDTWAGTNFAGTNATATLNSNGLSLSIADPGGGGAGVTVSRANIVPMCNLTTMAHSNATLFLTPFINTHNMTFTKAEQYVQVSFTTQTNNSQSSGTASISLGIYTYNNSTLSLLCSGSQTYSWSNSSNARTGTFFGMRALSVPISGFLNEGEPAVCAYWCRTTGHTMTVGPIIGSNMTAAYSGDWGVASATNQQLQPGQGVYSASITTAMPQSIRIGTDIKGDLQVRPLFCELMGVGLG